MLQIQYAKTLMKKIKQISQTLFEVDKHSVKIQTKKGRQLIICDCDNSSYFGHNQFCVHKLSLIIYLANNNFKEKIEKVIDDYERYKKIKLPVSIDLMLDDLDSLRRIK